MGALANAGGDTRTETPALAFAITRAAHLSYDHSMNRDQQGHGVGIPVRPGYAGPEPDASGNIHKGFSNRNRKAQNSTDTTFAASTVSGSGSRTG